MSIQQPITQLEVIKGMSWPSLADLHLFLLSLPLLWGHLLKSVAKKSRASIGSLGSEGMPGLVCVFH